MFLNYYKISQCYTPYCTDQLLYEVMMKLLIAHSNLSYCHFGAEENHNVVLPNDDGYYVDCDD